MIKRRRIRRLGLMVLSGELGLSMLKVVAATSGSNNRMDHRRFRFLDLLMGSCQNHYHGWHTTLLTGFDKRKRSTNADGRTEYSLSSGINHFEL